MEDLKSAFQTCKDEHRPCLVTYLTAGFPSIGESVEILLGLQKGGSDVIELGMPFSDPIADGRVIQKANSKALENKVSIKTCFEIVKEARNRGLSVPVVFMGYYNPVLQYGDDRLLADAKAAGVNGFILVDLPPEEAVRFRGNCIKAGLSYVPLIAPVTSEERMKVLCGIADSFIYVVSRMGVTGVTGKLSTTLPELLAKVHQYAGSVPTAVGFGVSTRDDFVSVGSISEGVVIGSQLITVVGESDEGKRAQAAEEYCRSITGRSVGLVARGVEVDKVITDASSHVTFDANTLATPAFEDRPAGLPSQFGEFGGQYVPESLMDCLTELETEFNAIRKDPKFWEDFRSFYPYMGRSSSFHLADRLTATNGGARIWLKREDLNHTGSHKINNALGQVLLARKLGKTEIIAETGAGQHGVATATICAKLGMNCTIYMGAEDVRRQALNVFRIRLLGAEVVAVEAGTRTLRDAVNECLRAWVEKLSTTHYVVGSAIGPHPFPTMVRTFQSVIGEEAGAQFAAEMKARGISKTVPDAVVACVGGGSNATGMFGPFADSKDADSVQLIGFEAGGQGVGTKKHAATLTAGTKGVLHGVKTYVLQSEEGQVQDTHSVSAGLDYPGVGPELAAWKDSGRASFRAVTDAEAFIGFRMMSQLEGIIPALETSHAIWGALQVAKELGPDKDVILCVSGRGDKDVQQVADELPNLGPEIGWNLRF